MIASLATEGMETVAAPFDHALVEAAAGNDKIVGLTADLAKYTDLHVFAQAYPDRFYRMGMAEQLMISAAAGLVREGFTPFATTCAVFASRRAYDFICMAIAEELLDVKIICALPGLMTGYGSSHQATEDIAIFRGLPNLTIHLSRRAAIVELRGAGFRLTAVGRDRSDHRLSPLVGRQHADRGRTGFDQLVRPPEEKIVSIIAALVFAGLLLLATPVAHALLIASGTEMIADEPLFPFEAILNLYKPTSQFPMLAIPFFILAGDLMMSGRFGEYLVTFSKMLVGYMKGGLAQVSVVGSLSFGGVSGSAVADASALGSALIPVQKKQGYPAGFAAAVNASSQNLIQSDLMFFKPLRDSV